MRDIPKDQHITYQWQYRKCGKAACSTCRNGQGHGPYWYAYWREGSRLRSGYVGKKHPMEVQITDPDNIRETPSLLHKDEYVTEPTLNRVLPACSMQVVVEYP